jgi:hypothetical protein
MSHSFKKDSIINSIKSMIHLRDHSDSNHSIINKSGETQKNNNSFKKTKKNNNINDNVKLNEIQVRGIF